MSEVKKIATRESYGNVFVEIGKEHEDLVVLDADLAGATKTAIFQKVFPERHIDCGIAEGNMMGVAAGLATTGKVPFASSFAIACSGARTINVAPCKVSGLVVYTVISLSVFSTLKLTSAP